MTINVYPGASNPSHQLSLNDGVQTWGLRLAGGDEVLKEEPLTPSTLRFAQGGRSGFGEWEPGLAQLSQRDWSGGSGLEFFSADDAASANRFHDSLRAWTLTPGVLHPAPQVKMARGLRAAIQYLPGDVSWAQLFGSRRYVSAAFTVGAADFAAARARVWLRRVGSPGALTLALHEDDGGAPGAALQNVGESITISEVTDVISEFCAFELGLESDLQAAANYHLVLFGSALDNAANHWELGIDADGSGGRVSADGDNWTEAGFLPYYRIEDESIARGFHFFRLNGAFYAVDQHADGSPSRVYINGDRGVCTASSANTLEDEDKSWETNQWQGARVRIVKGTGAGQSRKIISNSSSTLNLQTWNLQPDSTSEYVIYATDLWTDISPTTGDLIDSVVKDVAVVNDHALFAQGDSAPVLRMRFNAAASPPAHEFDDDGANTADLLHSFHRPSDGPQIWRAQTAAGQISRAAPTGWGAALTFGDAIAVGDTSHALRALFDWKGQLWVLKTDGFWQVAEDDTVLRVNVGLEHLPRESGGSPLAVFGDEVVFGWESELRGFDGSRIQAFSAGHAGRIEALQPVGGSRLAVAVSGKDGEARVLVWDGAAWHPLLVGPHTPRGIISDQANGNEPGHCEEAFSRRSNLAWQECPGARPRLWVTVDGDLAYVELPTGADPLDDPEFVYQHEAVLVGGTIDMGAPRLPKFLKEFSLLGRNLATGIQVELDVQVDGEIGGAAWRQAGAFYSSPLDTLSLNLGQVHALRPRLRLLTNKATVPPVVQATVLDGFARTPLKYRWTLKVQLADLQSNRSGGLDPDPDEFISWLQRAAREARKVRLRAIWESLDDKYVIVEPPSLARHFNNSALRWWGGVATVVLREA